MTTQLKLVWKKFGLFQHLNAPTAVNKISWIIIITINLKDVSLLSPFLHPTLFLITFARKFSQTKRRKKVWFIYIYIFLIRLIIFKTSIKIRANYCICPKKNIHICTYLFVYYQVYFEKKKHVVVVNCWDYQPFQVGQRIKSQTNMYLVVKKIKIRQLCKRMLSKEPFVKECQL